MDATRLSCPLLCVSSPTQPAVLWTPLRPLAAESPATSVLRRASTPRRSLSFFPHRKECSDLLHVPGTRAPPRLNSTASPTLMENGSECCFKPREKKASEPLKTPTALSGAGPPVVHSSEDGWCIHQGEVGGCSRRVPQGPTRRFYTPAGASAFNRTSGVYTSRSNHYTPPRKIKTAGLCEHE